MKVYVYLPLWNWPHLARKRMHGQLCRSWGVMLKTVFDPDGQNKCSSVSENWELLHLDLSNTSWNLGLLCSLKKIGQNPNIPTSTSMDSMVVNLHLVGNRPLLYLCPDRACSLFVHIMYIYIHIHTHIHTEYTYIYNYVYYVYIYIHMYIHIYWFIHSSIHQVYMYQNLSIHVGKYTGKHLNLSSGAFLNSSASGPFVWWTPRSNHILFTIPGFTGLHNRYLIIYYIYLYISIGIYIYIIL